MGLFGFGKKHNTETQQASTPVSAPTVTPVEPTGNEVFLDLNKTGLLNLEKMIS